jgi:hypothetical protein
VQSEQAYPQKLIPNDRYWQAVVALINHADDCRARVVLALQILESLRTNELDADLLERLNKVRKQASAKGSKVVNGNVIADPFTNTANGRRNKTYGKYAKEIFSIYEEMWTRYAYKEVRDGKK